MRTIATASLICIALAIPIESYGQEYKTYTVKAGDTLYRIARNNFVTVESLRNLNGIEGDHIEAGQMLWIDGKPENLETLADSVDAEPEVTPDTVEVVVVDDPPTVDSTLQARAEAALKAIDETPVADGGLSDSAGDEPILFAHTISAGETLYSIAALYGLSTDSLVLANPGYPTYFRQGDTLMIPWGGRLGYHRVVAGETLFRISRRFNTTVERIQELNRLQGTAIRVGQQLLVPLRPEDAATMLRIAPDVLGTGLVRLYPEMFEGRLMANGRPYIADRFFVSHESIPLGSDVLLVNLETGNQSFATVTDRLPPGSGVIMEISQAVFDQLTPAPETPVEIRRVR